MSNSSAMASSAQSRKGKGLHTLLQELSDDDEPTRDTGVDVSEDPQRLWLCDYHAYMDVLEKVPDGWTSHSVVGSKGSHFHILIKTNMFL